MMPMFYNLLEARSWKEHSQRGRRELLWIQGTSSDPGGQSIFNPAGLLLRDAKSYNPRPGPATGTYFSSNVPRTDH